MAFSYNLRVTQQDIDEYLFSLKKNTKINKFWKQVLKRMPTTLLKEVSSKYTNIEKNYRAIYIFKTKDASEELKEFLDKFTVTLNENSI